MTLVNLNNLYNDYKNMQSDELIYELRKTYGYDANTIATQILYYKKAVNKLPLFIKNGCWITSKSYEQSSSEATATFKSGLCQGNKMLDLTGGLGIDDIAFAKVFNEIISLDIDEELNTIVQYNVNKLDIGNITRLTTSAEEFIHVTHENFDLIYADADRRPDRQSKLFLLTDIQPNIIELLPRLKMLTSKLLLKLSPMLDLSLLKKQLPEANHIIVVSVFDEVKELLCMIDFSMENSDTTIEAVSIDESGKVLFSYKKQTSEIDIKSNRNDEQNVTAKYFYEPAGALIKSGLHHLYLSQQQLQTISKHSVFAIGNHFVSDFLGRAFEILEAVKFNKRLIKNYLSQHQIVKANIAKRYFPNEVTELKKIFDLSDGGSDFLFFTTDSKEQKWMFHCKKIIPLTV